MKTAEFSAFLTLYHAVLSSPYLTVAEKTAAIEAAFDDYNSRAQPGSYHAIVKRLANTRITPEASAGGKEIPKPAPAKEAPRGSNGVGARGRR